MDYTGDLFDIKQDLKSIASAIRDGDSTMAIDGGLRDIEIALQNLQRTLILTPMYSKCAELAATPKNIITDNTIREITKAYINNIKVVGDTFDELN